MRVVAGYQQRDAEWPHTTTMDAVGRKALQSAMSLSKDARDRRPEQSCSPSLSRFLHDGRNLLDEDPRGRVLSVNLPVGLSTLPGASHQYAEVRAHARVHHADVRADNGQLLQTSGVHKRGWGRLLNCEHNCVGGWRRRDGLKKDTTGSESLPTGPHRQRVALTLDAETCCSRVYCCQGMFDLYELG